MVHKAYFCDPHHILDDALDRYWQHEIQVRETHFTVFGGAYVPEHYNEINCCESGAIASVRDDSGPAWLVISSLLVGLTICAAEITFFAGRSSGLL